MSLIDICVLLFVLMMTLIGRKAGFVKTALGTVSVFACGFIAVAVYKYLMDAGVVAVIENVILSKVDVKTVKTLETIGVVGYLISGICTVIIFIATRFAYKFITDLLNFMVPSFINRFLGSILGFVKGTVIVFCLLAVVFYINGSVPEIVDRINETAIVAPCYYNNPIVNILSMKG